MKIIITSNYPIGNETGASKVAELLSKYLSSNNQVVLICIGEKYLESKINKNLSIVKIPMLDLKTFQIPLITPVTMYKVFAYLDKFKPDIIHAQNAVFVSKLAQIWSLINDVPFVISYHHIPTEAVFHLMPSLSDNILGNIVQEIYKNTSLKNTLKIADGVVAVNKSIYKSVRSVDNEIKIEVINNGVEVDELLKLKTKKLNRDKIRFVFLGSYNDRKNQMYLLKVFKRLPQNYFLNLYGKKETGGEYLNKLENYIKKHNIKNIKLHNFSNNITGIFDNSNFLISSSKKEAQSLVVIQSMAAGKPVIGLENETLDELINKNNGLKLNSKTKSKEFAKILIDYIDQIDYIKTSKQIRMDSKRFDIKTVVSKLEDFYKTICKTYRKNSRGNVRYYYNKIFSNISIIK